MHKIHAWKPQMHGKLIVLEIKLFIVSVYLMKISQNL